PSRFRNSAAARLSARSVTSYLLFIVVVSVGVLSYPSLPARAPRSHHDFLSPLRDLQLRAGQFPGCDHAAFLDARIATGGPAPGDASDAPRDVHMYPLADQVHWAAEGAK